MTIFETLTGHNTNKFVKENHVFIQGEGTFYETKELARKYNIKTGNEVGLFIDEIIHEGMKIYRELSTNVFD